MNSDTHLAILQIIEKGLENNMAIMTLDLKGVFTSYNKMAEKLFGYSPEELLFKKRPEIFYDSSELEKNTKEISAKLSLINQVGYDVLLEEARKNGREDSDWIGIKKDGTQFPVGFSTLAIALEPGKFIGYLLLAKDLTQKRKMEKEAEQQRAGLASASKLASLGEMAAGLAHEINNPLAVILGKASRCIQQNKNSTDPKKEETIRDLEKIVSSTERIARIIKNLRAFSRSAQNDPFEKVSIREIIEKTLELCAARFKSYGIEVTISEIPSIDIDCRETEIMQVVLSLLNNSFDAIQVLDEKWIKVEVRDVDAEKVEIIITDSGQGIPTEIADKLMQPFFTTKDIGKGTGLGLSAAQGIIQSHGGTLALDRKCKNTRFVITLPTKK